MRHRINRRQILFVGDLLMRQVFLRLVAHTRGLDALVERCFHQNAAYAMNGLYDVLSLYDKLSTGREDFVVLGARQVELQYLWGTSDVIFRRDLDLVQPKTVVMRINLGCNEACFRAQNISEHIQELTIDNEYLEHTVWPTTALLEGRTKGLPEWQNLPSSFQERNTAMSAWAAEAQAKTKVTMTIVGVDELVEQSPWGRNILEGGFEDAHFQCGALDEYPKFLRKDQIKPRILCT